jgi:hypothetical protein
MPEQTVQLRQKQPGLPEPGGFVWQMSGTPISELVVMDDCASRLGDVPKGIDVVVRATRSAVRHYQRRQSAAEVSADAIPGLVSLEGRSALEDVIHRDIPWK